MNEALILIAGWVVFSGSHMLLSSTPARPWLVQRMTLKGYRLLFTVIAFATFVPLCFYYAGHKHMGALLWSPLPHAIAAVLVFIAFFLFVASLFTPTAAGMMGTTTGVTGITRITRHAAFAAMIIWATAHMAVNPWLTDLVFFGGFVVQLLIGPHLMDKRKLAEHGESYQQFLDQTSYLPFAGKIKPKIVLSEYSAWVIPATVGLFALVYAFHDQLFK
ncbi:MAG: NnrU family protein [Gammaproteobacteria bacterium]|nr:NnrU family protein [Gammaproteobacteria bacterium]